MVHLNHAIYMGCRIRTNPINITLHKGGECHRVPGVQCNNVEFLGNEMPKADLYTRVCKDCFPNGVLWMSDPESSESS